MNKFPITLRLTDRDVEEGEAEAAAYAQDIRAGNLALARALDRMIQEETP